MKRTAYFNYIEEKLATLATSIELKGKLNILDFIKAELGVDVDMVKLDSNVATVINVLSKDDLNKNDQPITVNSFEIERKISFNRLASTKNIIDDYSIHHARVDKKYEQFDANGVNVSASVLNRIRMEYVRNLKDNTDDALIRCKIFENPNDYKYVTS